MGTSIKEVLDTLDRSVEYRPGYDEVANLWRWASPILRQYISDLEEEVAGAEGQGPCWT